MHDGKVRILVFETLPKVSSAFNTHSYSCFKIVFHPILYPLYRKPACYHELLTILLLGLTNNFNVDSDQFKEGEQRKEEHFVIAS